jgi:hypothetical protein
VPDAQAAHYRGKLRGPRCHERHWITRIGKIREHVYELRTRDVPALEVLPGRAGLGKRKGDLLLVMFCFPKPYVARYIQPGQIT